MKLKRRRLEVRVPIAGALILSGVVLTCSRPRSAQLSRAVPTEEDVIVCPKIWDEKELAMWATPVAGLGVRPGHYSEEEYYAAPIINLRTYPVYHPKFEPPGYREWIKSQGPRRLIEPEKLKTKADWIDAGRVVFEGLSSPGFHISDPAMLSFLSDADAIDAHDDIVTKDGQVLPYRWVVDESGELKVSAAACTSCHFLVLPDKSVVFGPGPGNLPTGDKPASPVFAALLATVSEPVVKMHSEGEVFYSYFGVPWVAGDEHARFKTMSNEDVVAWFNNNETDIPGAIARNNGSPFHTTRVADLLGVRHRRYLDATATHANRGPEDIARYGILVEYADNFVFGPHKLEFPERRKVTARAPDEALYAMGLYLYSLEPLPSPYPFDELAHRGEQIFEAEGCYECHTPPAYTNNKLIPVPGFEPDMSDPATQRLNISNRRVGTDAGLALKTRKGTGYYKIPSLRGLWYRGLYEHSGSVSSLEDWFDPKRLREDYVPSGWKGPGVKTRAVPGHTFGHDLPPEDKKALIAFLKTL
jgi:hypothetical protein